MTTATLQPEAPVDTVEDAGAYRALHAGAVVGLLIAICSLVYPMTVASLNDVQYLLLLGAIPLGALAVSAAALRAIRNNREVYTGGRIALAGVLLALVSLVGGTAYGGYVFATEVPDGYTRTSFQQWQPSEEDRAASRAIPEPVQELIREEQDVFIKGFIRPSSVKYKVGNKEFLLVRDNNECCFGDLNKVMYFDQVEVTMSEGKSVDYDDGLFRMGGKLSLRPGNPALDEPLIVYMLDADYVRAP